ncbi:hypothetical protein SeMB42_g04682 [Synchytrium endobioticum]|nr:hypothetical protein SeMB42_g04682 [Synchytrium endobioticum]
MAEKAQQLEVSLLGEKQLREELERAKTVNYDKTREIFTQTESVVFADDENQDSEVKEEVDINDGRELIRELEEFKTDATQRIENMQQQLETSQQESEKAIQDLEDQLASTKQHSDQAIQDLQKQLTTTTEESQAVIQELKKQVASSSQILEPLQKEIETFKESLVVEKDHAALAQKQCVELSVETERQKRQLATLEQERKELIEALFQIANDRMKKDENSAVLKRGTIQDVLQYYGIKLNALTDSAAPTIDIAGNVELARNSKPSANPAPYPKPLPLIYPPRSSSSPQVQSENTAVSNQSATLPPAPQASSSSSTTPSTIAPAPEKKIHGILKNGSSRNKPAPALSINPPMPSTSVNPNGILQTPTTPASTNPLPPIPQPPTTTDASPTSATASTMQVGPGSEAWDALLNLLDQTEKAQTVITHIRRPSDVSETVAYDVFSIKPRTTSLETKNNAKNNSGTPFGLKLKLPFGKEKSKANGKKGGRKDASQGADDDQWSVPAPTPKGKRPSNTLTRKSDDAIIEEEILGKKVTFASTP